MSRLKITLRRRESPLKALPWWFMAVEDVAAGTQYEFEVGDKVHITNRYENIPFFVIERFLCHDNDARWGDGNVEVELSLPDHPGHTFKLTPDQVKHMSPLERLAAEAPEVFQ